MAALPIRVAKSATTTGVGFHHPAAPANAVCTLAADADNTHLLHWIVVDATFAPLGAGVVVDTLTVAIGATTVLKAYLQREEQDDEVEQRPAMIRFPRPIASGYNTAMTIKLTAGPDTTAALSVGYT